MTTHAFDAEIKKVLARKTASSDMEIQLTVATDDTRVMDLGKLPPDTAVRITIEPITDQIFGAARKEDEFATDTVDW